MKQLYLKSIILAIFSIISIKASAYDCEVKYSTKGSDFSKFYVYFCHVIDDFCLFLFATLR